MTKPLALVCYANLLPGSQLVNRLQDLGYRVTSHTDAATLPALARESKAFLIVLDLSNHPSDICQSIREVRENSETAHIPILAFGRDNEEPLRTAAHAAGAALVAGDVAILAHLPELLDQALDVGSDTTNP